MGFSAADILPVVIEKVDPEVFDIFESSAPFIKRLKGKKAIETNNRGVRLVVRVRPNPNTIWYDTDGGGFPADGTSIYIDMRVFYASIVTALGFTKQALDINETDVLVNILTQRFKDDSIATVKQMEVQSWHNGDGRIGVIANGGINGAAITMTTPTGGTDFIIGGTYNFYAPDGTLRNGGGISNSKVLSIASGLTVTFDQVANNLQAGDIATLRGSYQRSIHGVPYHISNAPGAYQGQSRASFPELNATVFDSQGATISVAIINRTIALNKYKMGVDVDQNDFEIWTSPCQYQQYMNLGYGFLRFAANAEGGGTFNGSFAKGVKHGSLMWWEALNCPDDTLYGIRMNSMGWYELDKLRTLTPDGLTMRLIPDFSQSIGGSYKAGTVAYIGASGDIGCHDPRRNFSIINLSTANQATKVAAA